MIFEINIYPDQLSTIVMESLYHTCQMVDLVVTQLKIHVNLYKVLVFQKMHNCLIILSDFVPLGILLLLITFLLLIKFQIKFFFNKIIYSEVLKYWDGWDKQH